MLVIVDAIRSFIYNMLFGEFQPINIFKFQQCLTTWKIQQYQLPNTKTIRIKKTQHVNVHSYYYDELDRPIYWLGWFGNGSFIRYTSVNSMFKRCKVIELLLNIIETRQTTLLICIVIRICMWWVKTYICISIYIYIYMQRGTIL